MSEFNEHTIIRGQCRHGNQGECVACHKEWVAGTENMIRNARKVYSQEHVDKLECEITRLKEEIASMQEDHREFGQRYDAMTQKYELENATLQADCLTMAKHITWSTEPCDCDYGVETARKYTKGE